MEMIVNLGDFITTNREDAVLRTFSLASCVAVTVYCPMKKAAGMIHVVLPAPLNSRDKQERPGYFAQTGIPLLIEAMCRQYGCEKSQLTVKLYGGAESLIAKDIYQIGKKNIDAVKQTLLDMGLTIQGEDLRGGESRTISMEVKTGSIRVARQPILR